MFGDACRDLAKWTRAAVRLRAAERVQLETRLCYFLGYLWERQQRHDAMASRHARLDSAAFMRILIDSGSYHALNVVSSSCSDARPAGCRSISTRALPIGFVTIPIASPRVRSLNLSTSVAIAVYEALRQRRTAGR